MANNIQKNPWVLDTPAAPSVANNVWPSLVIPGLLHFEFFGYTLAASKAIITDVDGQTICELTGTSDLQEVRSGRVGTLHRGVCLSNASALNSGIVLVYLK